MMHHPSLKPALIHDTLSVLSSDDISILDLEEEAGHETSWHPRTNRWITVGLR